MRPIIAKILMATAVTSNGLLFNDDSVTEAYNANNLYRNLDHLTQPAYVDQPLETSNENRKCKKSYDWAI